MKHIKYQQEFGAALACNTRMRKATKGIGQKYRKGVTKDFLFLKFGAPYRGWKKL